MASSPGSKWAFSSRCWRSLRSAARENAMSPKGRHPIWVLALFSCASHARLMRGKFSACYVSRIPRNLQSAESQSMNANDTLRITLNTSSVVLSRYLDDLSDADLMQRPGPGCNHLAWQAGHLISSENQLLESVAPGRASSFPKDSQRSTAKKRRAMIIRLTSAKSRSTWTYSKRSMRRVWPRLRSVARPISISQRRKNFARCFPQPATFTR